MSGDGSRAAFTMMDLELRGQRGNVESRPSADLPATEGQDGSSEAGSVDPAICSSDRRSQKRRVGGRREAHVLQHDGPGLGSIEYEPNRRNLAGIELG